MSKLEDNVNEILGIDKKAEDKTFENESNLRVSDFQQPAPVPRKIDETKSDVDNDYSHSRDNYYNLIDKGNEAIEGILDIAKEGQHPRAYEVAGQLIGQVAQTVDKLQDLQKKLKDLKEVPNKTNTQIKNALFVGSTNELQKMLNRKKEDEIIEGESGQPEKDNTGD